MIDGTARTPTGRETDLLKALWDLGPSRRPGRARRHQQGVGRPDRVQHRPTMLRLMEGKQLVTHHTEGRTFIYTPRFSREESAARFLDRVFDGAASELMLSLIRAERCRP